jgi:hypothetical protein
MADHARSDAMQDRDQFAVYVAQLTSELAAVARKHRLDALGYLLDWHNWKRKMPRNCRERRSQKPRLRMDSLD